jgi:hypothetical protein
MAHVFVRFFIVMTLLAGVSCLSEKPHQTQAVKAQPFNFVLNRMDTTCFTVAEAEKLRGGKSYVTIAFDEMILDTVSHCLGLYRYGLSEKPAWPAAHGIKCYALKFRDKIEIAEQQPNRVVILDDFFAQYGKMFTEQQQKDIRAKFMSDCTLVQGE